MLLTFEEPPQNIKVRPRFSHSCHVDSPQVRQPNSLIRVFFYKNFLFTLKKKNKKKLYTPPLPISSIFHPRTSVRRLDDTLLFPTTRLPPNYLQNNSRFFRDKIIFPFSGDQRAPLRSIVLPTTTTIATGRGAHWVILNVVGGNTTQAPLPPRRGRPSRNLRYGPEA